MSHFGVKPFTSSNSNNNNRMSISPASPPMQIPDSKPVQAASPSPTSSLMVGLVTGSATSKISAIVPRRKESTASETPNDFQKTLTFGTPGGMPKLEPAPTSLSGVVQELEEGIESPSASLNIVAARQGIQHASRREENQAVTGDSKRNFSSYTSEEVRKSLNCNKLLQCSNKKGHTWNQAISIEIHKKKVCVRIFIFPRVSDNDHTQTTKLDVTADLGRKLLKMLQDSGIECQIKVETEVWDTTAGENMCCTQFSYHTVCMDDGKANFRQDLVPCEKVRACRSNSVTLVVKVTLCTRQNNDYKMEEAEFGFLSIKMPTVARRQ